MNWPMQLNSVMRYWPSKPVRDPAYLRFLRKLPCIVCFRTYGIAPMHTGPHGLGEKASDMDALPGCRKHHREFDDNPVAFAEKHHLDVRGNITRLNAFYAELKRRAA